MTKQIKPPKAPNKPKPAQPPKVVLAEIEEFKRMCRELEVHSIKPQGDNWAVIVSAPKYGDAGMLEHALTYDSSARYKRIETVDQHTLEITL